MRLLCYGGIIAVDDSSSSSLVQDDRYHHTHNQEKEEDENPKTTHMDMMRLVFLEDAQVQRAQARREYVRIMVSWSVPVVVARLIIITSAATAKKNDCLNEKRQVVLSVDSGPVQYNPNHTIRVKQNAREGEKHEPAHGPMKCVVGAVISLGTDVPNIAPSLTRHHTITLR